MTGQEFYEIAGVKQHAQFESYLKKIVLKKKEREAFYDKLLEKNNDLSTDAFKDYFEFYNAERKTNKQDYTPEAVAYLLSILTRTTGVLTNGYAGVDWTAGSGSLLIKKWWDDKIQEDDYIGQAYVYLAQEYADNVIPYLLHNIAMCGMNCIVIHGDTLAREAKAIYFLQQNGQYSDINLMPQTEEVEKSFSVKFIEKQKEYTESDYKQFDLNTIFSKKKRLPAHMPNSKPYASTKKQLMLREVAEVERAVKGKIYPKGTIIIQISATHGQIGMLQSDGEVESKYACVMSKENDVLFHAIKRTAPEHFHRVQEGLNLTLEDIKDIPLPDYKNKETAVKALDEIDVVHDHYEQKYKELKQLKKVMLRKMFV